MALSSQQCGSATVTRSFSAPTSWGALSAASFLADLDDGLHAKFDIVDTMTQVKADSYPSLAALINDAVAG